MEFRAWTGYLREHMANPGEDSTHTLANFCSWLQLKSTIIQYQHFTGLLWTSNKGSSSLNAEENVCVKPGRFVLAEVITHIDTADRSLFDTLLLQSPSCAVS